MERVRDKETLSRNVLDRFSNQIGWVVDSVMESFELEDHFYDDLRQEANIRVLTFAGILEGYDEGLLFKFVKKAEGDEKQVKAMLGKQLRLRLSQLVSRQIEKNNGESMTGSLDALVEEGREPVDETFEARTINLVNGGSLLDMHERYPYLAANILDGFTQDQIAEAMNITSRTVRNRIMREKRQFLIDYLTRAGLVVEGDETLDELSEAFGYLRVAGR